jgi:hypothetical protein
MKLRRKRETEPLPLQHTDSASFDADHRVGAVLLDELGRVLCRRVESPLRNGSAVRDISPWASGLPAGHPRLNEGAESSLAVIRDSVSAWR